MTSATCCRSVVLGAVRPLASATATWRGSFLTSVALKMKLRWTYVSSDNDMSCDALYINNTLKKKSSLCLSQDSYMVLKQLPLGLPGWITPLPYAIIHSALTEAHPPIMTSLLGCFAPININICAHFCFVSSFWNVWLFPVFLSQVEFHPKTQNSISEHFGWRYAALEGWFETSPGCQAAPCASISHCQVQRGSLRWTSGDLGHLTHKIPGTAASSDRICVHFHS